MAAGRGGARDRPGHGAERPTQRRRVPGGVERARPPAGFQHDRCCTRCGDQSVSLQKAPFRGRRSTGQLGENGPSGHDAGEQGVVATRVEPVDSAGKKGHGNAVTGQCCAVGHSVDAVGGAGHHGKTTVDEPGRGLHGDVLAIAGGCPGPDQGDRVGQRGERAGHPAPPQRQWRMLLQVIDRCGPEGVRGQQ